MGNVLRPIKIIIELLYNMLFAKQNYIYIYIYKYILCVYLRIIYAKEANTVYSSTQNRRRFLTSCFKGVQTLVGPERALALLLLL